MSKYCTCEPTCKVSVGVCHLTPVDQRGTADCPVPALVPERSLNADYLRCLACGLSALNTDTRTLRKTEGQLS